ncbi:MAG TPA: FAD-dependent oxidoreductase [Dehalococcoidia bacterium]|nr:FAD-dependent oxidoreductase [Dehalococcoidia bacterium]
MARKHLIIGCGSAALSALEKIRSIAPGDQVKLTTMEDCPPYSPTALPYLLSGRVAEEALWMRPEGYFETLGATLARGKEVVRVSPASKEVVYQDGERENYDTLLIATGSEPVRPPIVGLDEAGFLGFRTIADYRALAGRLDSRKRVAVLGGGLIGMEVAIALLEKGHQVRVVEKEPRLLPLYFDPEAEALIREVFIRQGAQLHTGMEATEVRRRNGTVDVALSGGTSLEVDLLVTAVGVRPKTSFLASSGIAINRGIVVDEQMRAGALDVYAAGDVAEGPGFFDEKGLNPILPSAVAQGRAAGAAMAGQPETYEGWIPMNVFNFFGYVAFSVGLSMPQGESFQVATASDDRAKSYRKLVFRDRRLVGAMFLNVAADPGVFSYLVRKRLDVGAYQEALLEKPREVARYLMMANEKKESAVAE